MPLVLHPERYHGDRETHDFFEGWYFKCVNRTSGLVIAVVPGIFRSRAQTPEHSHAFVFVNVNGTEQHYYRFPLDAFVAAKDEFKVTIAGDNVFTANGITLNLEPKDGDDATLSLVGRLTFAGGIPWPVSIVSPGVMGPVAYMPRVECFHGIVSMDHEVNGSLKIGATHEHFERGQGYLEKDWGKHFPSAWVWIQTNTFLPAAPHAGDVKESDKTAQNPSLFFSAAHVPYMGTSFPGFICGFLDTKGHLHKFALYLLSSVNTFKVDNTAKTIEIEVQNWTHKLNIFASFDVPMAVLYGPENGQMRPSVPEALRGEVHVRLCKSSCPDVALFGAKGECAGIEVYGDMNTLTRGLAKNHSARL